MWLMFKESITEPLRVFCNIMAFAIPFGIYIINQHLHKSGDPPWKKDNGDRRAGSGSKQKRSQTKSS